MNGISLTGRLGRVHPEEVRIGGGGISSEEEELARIRLVVGEVTRSIMTDIPGIQLWLHERDVVGQMMGFLTAEGMKCFGHVRAL